MSREEKNPSYNLKDKNNETYFFKKHKYIKYSCGDVEILHNYCF